MKINIAALCAISALSACAPEPFSVETIADAKPASMRSFAEQYKGKTLCTDYKASSNSCLSLMKFSVQGRKFVITETMAIDRANTMTTRSVARLEGNKSCTQAKDIQLVKPQTADAKLILNIARSIAKNAGGVCSEVLQNKDGYVYRVKGRNGETIPPGEIRVRIAPANAKLRP